MLRFAAFVAACSVALVVLAASSRSAAPRAEACTGGVGPLEWLTENSDLIVLGRAVEVGDAANHAPPATPTASRTSTPTATTGRSPGTPITSSSPTPIATMPVIVPSVDLAGIGMTLAVERAYVGGASANIAIDANVRSGIERELRDIEAGILRITDCRLDAFVARYHVGLRYLLFVAGEPDQYVAGVFIVDGQDVVLDDPELSRAATDRLYMSLDTYQRFFSGVPTASRYAGEVTLATDRVPLFRVLRAVAFLRGDPSIAPPETGSAGLASGRR